MSSLDLTNKTIWSVKRDGSQSRLDPDNRWSEWKSRAQIFKLILYKCAMFPFHETKFFCLFDLVVLAWVSVDEWCQSEVRMINIWMVVRRYPKEWFGIHWSSKHDGWTMGQSGQPMPYQIDAEVLTNGLSLASPISLLGWGLPGPSIRSMVSVLSVLVFKIFFDSWLFLPFNVWIFISHIFGVMR